jgi:hypothetical protein
MESRGEWLGESWMTLNFPQPGLASSPASASHGPSEPSGGGLPGKSPPRLRIFQDCRSYPRLRASLALFAMPGKRGCPSLAVLICSFSRSLVASPSPTHNISRPSGAMGKPTLRMPVSTHGGSRCQDCNLRELHSSTSYSMLSITSIILRAISLVYLFTFTNSTTVFAPAFQLSHLAIGNSFFIPGCFPVHFQGSSISGSSA